jgi:hypothetical protein
VNVYIAGKRVTVEPARAIGKGGEADIYDITISSSDPIVLKLFKQPDHPDLIGDKNEQSAATARLQRHQHKLPEFPKNLPANVIGPKDLAYSAAKNGSVVGYTMTFLNNTEPLLRYQEKKFRAGAPADCIRDIFLDLHRTVDSIHSQSIVIGDFHDLNILVNKAHTAVAIIDTDSFQFGKWFCNTFTEVFVDPLLCDNKATSPTLVCPHNAMSDWYAYAIMLMRCMLFVGPYGGIYKPKDHKKNIPHPARPMHRISVFHPDVQYPKPAIPYKLLSDELLHHLIQVFEQDYRVRFPEQLVADLRWTTCNKCGIAHARRTCPDCKPTPAAAVASTTTIRGKVTVSTLFKLKQGRIVFATVQGGDLKYVYHDGNEYCREGGRTVLKGALIPSGSARIRGADTLMIEKHGFMMMKPGDIPLSAAYKGQTYTSDSCDANSKHFYWSEAGVLKRDDVHGPAFIGNVLMDRTKFWVGEAFGFGFYRAGNLSVAFVFDAERQGINDNVKFPRITGELMDCTCVFTDKLAWSFQMIKAGAKTINRCVVVTRAGDILATAEADAGDPSWLGSIRGKAPVSGFLFAATDDGLVRVEVQNGALVVTRQFPDTESFVDSETRLLVTGKGLVAVGPQEIKLIEMK